MSFAFLLTLFAMFSGFGAHTNVAHQSGAHFAHSLGTVRLDYRHRYERKRPLVKFYLT